MYHVSFLIYQYFFFTFIYLCFLSSFFEFLSSTFFYIQFSTVHILTFLFSILLFILYIVYMHCPNCSQIMISAIYDEQTVLHCRTCGSSFFEENGINHISLE